MLSSARATFRGWDIGHGDRSLRPLAFPGFRWYELLKRAAALKSIAEVVFVSNRISQRPGPEFQGALANSLGRRGCTCGNVRQPVPRDRALPDSIRQRTCLRLRASRLGDVLDLGDLRPCSPGRDPGRSRVRMDRVQVASQPGGCQIYGETTRKATRGRGGCLTARRATEPDVGNLRTLNWPPAKGGALPMSGQFPSPVTFTSRAP